MFHFEKMLKAVFGFIVFLSFGSALIVFIPLGLSGCGDAEVKN